MARHSSSNFSRDDDLVLSSDAARTPDAELTESGSSSWHGGHTADAYRSSDGPIGRRATGPDALDRNASAADAVACETPGWEATAREATAREALDHDAIGRDAMLREADRESRRQTATQVRAEARTQTKQQTGTAQPDRAASKRHKKKGNERGQRH